MNIPSSPAYTINPLPKLKTITHSNHLKSQNTIASNSPGPGAYHLEIFDKSPSWKIGQQKRNTQYIQDNPGPGQYLIKRQIIQHPGITFKNKYYSQIQSKQSPGPGAYDPAYNKILKKQPSYKIATTKMQLGRIDKSPGPGQYNQKINQDISHRGIKFGKQQRKGLDTFQQTPGPGKYQAAQKHIYGLNSPPKFSFGKSKRIYQGKKSSPGPGTYQLQSIFQKKSGIKLIQRSEHFNNSIDVPGPGTYQSKGYDKLMRNGPAYSFRKKKDSLYQYNLRDKNPGPLDYTIPDNIYQKQGKITLGKQKRLTLDRQETPGPGSYHLNTSIGSEGPKFTVPKGHLKIENHINNQKTPGPGQYSTAYMNSSKQSIKISFPKYPRLKSQTQIGPGPGNYDIIKSIQKGKSFSIGTGKRTIEVDQNKTQNFPGPGQYNIQSTISNFAKYQRDFLLQPHYFRK